MLSVLRHFSASVGPAPPTPSPCGTPRGHQSGVAFTVTRDMTAPVVYVQAPTAHVSGTFDVSWGAQDEGAGPNGVYDVQYRVGHGAWVDWFTGTTDTSASFTGESGHVYHFRLRTWDNACAKPILSPVEGLVEAWAM